MSRYRKRGYVGGEGNEFRPSSSASYKEPEEARSYFYKGMSDRERAIFEGGIALGFLYHRLLGLPLMREEGAIRALERALEASLLAQPFRVAAKVRIARRGLKGRKGHAYDYSSLGPQHLSAKVVCRYGKAEAVVGLRYLPKLGYPLMYVERVVMDEEGEGGEGEAKAVEGGTKADLG